jgi:hypothetical protein
LTVSAGLFALGAAILLARLGFASSVPRERVPILRKRALVLATLAVIVGLVSSLTSNPPPVIANMDCTISGDYAPVEVRCVSKTTSAAELEWRYENGELASRQTSISRDIAAPGDYAIKLLATGRSSIWKEQPSVDEFSFHVGAKPLPPEVRTRSETLQLASSSAERRVNVFSIKATEGFQIVDFQISESRNDNARVRSTELAEDGSSLSVTLEATGRLEVRGFKVKFRSAKVTALITLTEQERVENRIKR